MRSSATIAAVSLAFISAGMPARAAVTHFEIVSRQAGALDGRVFGAAGTVERIVGKATIALNPKDRRNAVIVDIASAPRNAQGMVEVSTDVVILRPAHPNGALVLELPNRGGALLGRWVQGASDFVDAPDPGAPAAPAPAGRGGRRGAPPAAGAPAPARELGPVKANDAGDGFLLNQGFTLVWTGWQGDVRGGFGVKVPVAVGLTGMSRDMWTFNDTATTKQVSLTYAAAEPFKAKLTVRDEPDAPAQTPAGLTFRFIDNKTVEITRPAGAKSDSVYELTYTARDPSIMGAGFAATRDVSSFLHFNTGSENPLAANGKVSVDRAIATGISQSGRALRDFLYLGFNEDEKGRKVFEGMLPIVPGARRSFTNFRFAQPGRNPGPLDDRLYPVDQFPFAYSTQADPLSGKHDGLLLRCTASKTCPRITELDSEYEFWGSHAALNVVDTHGKPIPVPANVRLYFMTGAQHSSWGSGNSRPSTTCAMSSTPVRMTPFISNMFLDLDAWVKNDTAPPASRYPSVTDGTLVALKDAYPAIPQLPYKQQINKAYWIDQTQDGPVVRGEYPLMVPKAGPDGNALAGVHLPIVAVPQGTYTGWNPKLGTTSPEGLCTQAGGAVPFAKTRAERLASGDPRPSVEELYPTQDTYVAKVREAADKLVADRLILKEDADAAVEAARQGKLSKLVP